MKDIEAIKYLETLEIGSFLTVNIPISANEKVSVTAMYAGKDKEGRYEFLDTGEFILSKNFLERGQISIEKGFDEDMALKIHSRIRKEYEKAHNKNHKKNRDVR